MSKIERKFYTDDASQARPFTFSLQKETKIEETAKDEAVKNRVRASIGEGRWNLWREALDDYNAKRNECLQNHFEKAKQAELTWAKSEYEKSDKSDEEKTRYDNYVQEIRRAPPDSRLLYAEHYFTDAETQLLAQKATVARKYELQIFNRMKEIFNESGYRVVKRCTSEVCSLVNQKLGKIIDKNGQWFIDKQIFDHLSREQREAREHTQPTVKHKAVILRSSSWD